MAPEYHGANTPFSITSVFSLFLTLATLLSKSHTVFYPKKMCVFSNALTIVHWMSSSYTADQLSILFHKLRALGICFWMGSVNWESEVGKAVRSAWLFPFRIPYSGQFLHQNLQLPVEAVLLTSLLVLLNTLHSWEWQDTSTVKSSKYEFFRTPLSPW